MLDEVTKEWLAEQLRAIASEASEANISAARRGVLIVMCKSREALAKCIGDTQAECQFAELADDLAAAEVYSAPANFEYPF